MTNGGLNTLFSRSATQLSAALLVLDPLSSDRRPAGSVHVSVSETGKAAVRNRSGYYLILDHSPGPITVQIESDFYLPETVAVTVPEPGEEPALAEVRLMPNPAYPFPSDIALLRGIVRRQGGEAADRAEVSVTVMQPQTFVKARLAEPAHAGDTAIKLELANGPLAAGDVLMIRESAAKSEFCKLAEVVPPDQGDAVCMLTGSLKQNYDAMTPLYWLEPYFAATTRTAAKGEWALPVASMRSSIGYASVTAAEPGLTQSVQLDAEIMEGSVTSLGVITLPPL
jgi:hypothetical protein